MDKRRKGKVFLTAALFLWAFMARFLTGCSVEKADQDKVRDLEFTVVSEAELPEELAKLVAEKKAAPFKLTYSNDQGLYIAVGYGEQATGGYSIAVRELYLTENSRGWRRKILSVSGNSNRIPGESGDFSVNHGEVPSF